MKRHRFCSLFSLLIAFSVLRAEVFDRKPSATNPSDHAFPALGATAQRKVNVEWNRFYDSDGLSAILAQLHQAFPELTRLYSVGQSIEGRELWCLEVTAHDQGVTERKPAMYIDGNIHSN